MEEAILILNKMLESKYTTTLEYDLKLLAGINGNTETDESILELISSKKSLWRFKLAVMHRVNQKEIIARQVRLMEILLSVLKQL